MAKNVEIEGLKELYQNLDRLTKSEGKKAIEQGFNVTVQEILVDSQRRLTDNGSRVTGKLFRSGRARVINGKEVTAEVEYVADYAYYTEFGRRAGRMPPVSDILQWVKKKGFYSSSSIKTKRRSTTKAGRKAQESLAWAISKSIAQKGTKARPFLYPAFQKIGLNGLVKNIQKEFNEVIQQKFNK